MKRFAILAAIVAVLTTGSWFAPRLVAEQPPVPMQCSIELTSQVDTLWQSLNDGHGGTKFKTSTTWYCNYINAEIGCSWCQVLSLYKEQPDGSYKFIAQLCQDCSGTCSDNGSSLAPTWSITYQSGYGTGNFWIYGQANSGDCANTGGILGRDLTGVYFTLTP